MMWITVFINFILQGPYLASDPECNHTKGCFHDCRRGVCSFIVSWMDRRGYLDMEIRAHIPSGGDKWMALGFSYDKRMVRYIISDRHLLIMSPLQGKTYCFCHEGIMSPAEDLTVILQ